MGTPKQTRRTLISAAAAALAARPSPAQQTIPSDDPNSKATIGGAKESAAGATVQVKVTNQVTVGQPISDLLYGNFIELGFGRQIEGMRAEMFYNRSFEVVPPYENSYGWLRRTKADDLSKEVWWHSGYEEEPWRAEPVSPQVKFQPHASLWFRHGVSHSVLHSAGSEPAFLVQSGMWLRKGMTYRFSGYLRSGEPGKYNEKPVAVSVGLYSVGDLTKPVVTQQITITRDWKKFTLDLACRDYAGRASFAVRIPGGAFVSCDAFSLMPAGNMGGWRADVVNALRQVKPGIIRFPGGCFASAHHWREGIGPSDERVPPPPSRGAGWSTTMPVRPSLSNSAAW